MFPLGEAFRGYRNSSWRSQSASSCPRVNAGSAAQTAVHHTSTTNDVAMRMVHARICRLPFIFAPRNRGNSEDHRASLYSPSGSGGKIVFTSIKVLRWHVDTDRFCSRPTADHLRRIWLTAARPKRMLHGVVHLIPLRPFRQFPAATTIGVMAQQGER